MRNTTKKTKIILIGLCLIFVSCAASEAVSPRRSVKEGNLYYQKGDYAASLANYEKALEADPESAIVNFNLGTALYKEKNYEGASDHLQKALLSDDVNLKESAYFNLGNALYQQGMTQADGDIAEAISSLEKSLSQYERAGSLAQEGQDAKHNYQFVEKELLRLKEKQQQQQKQDQKKSDQSDEDQQKQDQPSPQEQQGQKSQEEQQKQDQPQQGEQQEGQEEQQQDQGSREEQKDQEQQAEQLNQEDQSQGQKEKSEQGNGQDGKEDYNEQQGEGAQPQDAQELTEKEAQMLLESYQQAEEPQGLLKVHQKKSGLGPVFKDW